MGTVKCQRYIYDEFARHPKQMTIGVDLFFGGGVAVHDDVASGGYAQAVKLPDDLVAAVPEQLNGQPLRDAEGYWYGTALSGFGILFNPEACRIRRIPPPSTWNDLAGHEYEGWNALADPSVSGSTLKCLALAIMAHGWEEGWGIALGILANTNGFLTSSSHVGPAVKSGLCVAGLVPEFVARQLIDEAPESLAYVNPANATAVFPDPITLLKGAPNPKVATSFIQFVLSAEGQALWALPPEESGAVEGPLHQYPIRPDVYEKHAGKLAMESNPFLAGESMSVDTEVEAALTRVLPVLFRAANGGNHLLLQTVWREAARSGNDTALKLLKKPPMTEEEAIHFAEQFAEQPERIRKMEREWAAQFRALYETALGAGQPSS
jgi:ABC-type Fe3+ transport system substrate-binding protein